MKTKRERMSEQLRQIMKDSGKSYKELAEALRVGPSMVGFFLRGDKTFSQDTLDRACRYFHLDLVEVE